MSLSPSEEKKDIVLHDEYAQDIPKVDAVLGLSHLTPAEAARTVDRIKAVRNAAFAAAIAKSPIDWKSRSSMLLYWTLFICLCVDRRASSSSHTDRLLWTAWALARTDTMALCSRVFL